MIGTWVLSVLAGHKRYDHITALRSDRVLAELLGLERIVSEDSVRRALKALPEAEGLDWLQRHIDQCTHPLGVEMAPGDEHTGAHSAPGLWALIDGLAPDCWPALLRGDTGIASEDVMREAEGRGLDYLFKLRSKRLVTIS